MYLEYLTGTSWSSLILSNISSLRQKQIKIKKQKTYWHLFFSPVETAQLLYKELEPLGSGISRLVNTEPAIPADAQAGKGSAPGSY